MLNPSLPVVLVNPTTGKQIEVHSRDEYFDLVYGAGYREAPPATPAPDTEQATKDTDGGDETQTAQL